jgi:AcrR family transcriptional regulator
MIDMSMLGYDPVEINSLPKSLTELRCPAEMAVQRGAVQNAAILKCLTINRQVCILPIMRRGNATSEARQRILETADRLFYLEGIRAVGIDRIVAEAGVAKMTLYSHFPSKDDLILAVLWKREEAVEEFFKMAMSRRANRSKGRLRAFFAALKELFESPGFRGCPFINATVELADPAHPGAKFVQEHKRRFGEFLRRLIEEAVGEEAVRVAPAVAMLVDGAAVTAVIQGSPDAADVARDTSLKLVAAVKRV